MPVRRPPLHRESGQSAVESALTMPLAVFLILGTLQLFMMLQGRIMAEYAVFKAARVGSVNQGSCRRMTHAAIAALLPSISPFLGTGTPGGSEAEKLAEAFRARKDNKYDATLDWSGARKSEVASKDFTGDIIWLFRPSPDRTTVAGNQEDFDDPSRSGGPITLELRLIYWFPLRIPFADWVMSRIFLAHAQLRNYEKTNPLIPTVRSSNWQADRSFTLNAKVAAAFKTRVDNSEYVFPIQATHAMRMMTPPSSANFATQHCAPVPP